ncbi:lytic transglycosylase domain-containing protein [Gordonia sp. SMJS1]|uniref:lytic transglycosylase domain-containing protein n=1 Tax=Gordonia sp. SMJS1 TaxID=3039400 RepID=UPI002453E5C9|nr:lytic transglycosylase domain-containing protein [Gordonia sp. SMJS1]WGJ88248.1 lytic transglycosylase domain-containing protein [Gordonia sp. SMJS1]
MATPSTTSPARCLPRWVYAAASAVLILAALAAALVLTTTKSPADAEPPFDVPAAFAAPLTEYGTLCDGVDPAILGAQVHIESNFEKGHVSVAGATGYAQMLPRDWARYGHGGNPNNPRDAVRALAELDCSLLAVAHGRGCHGEDAVRVTLAMYNAGEAAVRGCTVPANGETDRYVARVLALR